MGEFVDQLFIDNFQFLAFGFFVMVPHGSPINNQKNSWKKNSNFFFNIASEASYVYYFLVVIKYLKIVSVETKY